MDRTALQQALTEILDEERGEAYEGLTAATKLREDLGLDSVDVIGMVMRIQERFRVSLSNDELMKIVTLGDVLDLIESKLGKQLKAA